MGEYRKAIEDLDKAISLNTRDQTLEAYSRNARALAFAGLQDYKQALTEFEASIKLCPENGWVYYNRGLAYEWMGKSNKALTDFKTALEKKNPPLNAIRRERTKARVQQANRRI